MFIFKNQFDITNCESHYCVLLTSVTFFFFLKYTFKPSQIYSSDFCIRPFGKVDFRDCFFLESPAQVFK